MMSFWKIEENIMLTSISEHVLYFFVFRYVALIYVHIWLPENYFCEKPV